MKLNITAGIIAIVLLVAMHSASATSFIVDCQYDDYRTNTSDVVFTGVVTEIDYHSQSTDITFDVEGSEKGEVAEAMTLTQPGNIKTGNHMIPSLTLEWEVGDTYRIQAAYQSEFDSETETSLQLTCGEMGRELIEEEPEMCAQVITYAQDPETGDVQEYPTPCDVPQGWQVVDEPQPAEHEETPEPNFWNKIGNWLRNLF